MSRHLHRHLPFYIAVLLGVAAWFGLETLSRLDEPARLSLAGDVFFAAYLASALFRLRGATPDAIRRRAGDGDEGILIIILITLGAVILSLDAIFGLVNASDESDTVILMLSLLGVPLGWTTFHTVMAFHYAHRYYAPHADGGGKDAGGLEFPGGREPIAWDFMYYSFDIGMTAQVSDVEISDPALRRMTLLHSIPSFFFNTVILALAVNVAVAQAS
jgi:uncharacterized membrane protein